MKKTTLLIFLLIGYAETSSAQLFGPRNYEDCIIEGMQGIASDLAAEAVRSACREKFPLPPRPPRSPLTFDYKGAREAGYTQQEVVTYFTEAYSISELNRDLLLIQENSSLASSDHQRAIAAAIEELSTAL
tara:strand:+ start:46 stop:438 length:393 start_codon:yes stop_codon:yes gene_type:complete